MLPLFAFGQTKKIKTVVVKEKGYNVNTQFKPIVDIVTNDKFSIKITPISANNLNEVFIKKNGLNGKLEYSKYESSIRSYIKRRKRNFNTDVIRSDYGMFIMAIDSLLHNNKIDDGEYNNLKDQIVEYFKPKENSVTSLNNTISSNPYYIDSRYLNVFKIEITNQTHQDQTFNSDMSIISSSVLLKPVSKEQLISLLEYDNKLNIDKLLSIERFHLPKAVELPSFTKVKYYFACLPIDFNKEVLTIKFSQFDQKFEWSLINNHNEINQIHTFYEFDVNHRFENFIYENDYNRIEFIVVNESQNSIYYDGNDILINKFSIYQKIEVIGICLSENTILFGRNYIKGSDHLDFKKSKRSRIPISYKDILNINREVK